MQDDPTTTAAKNDINNINKNEERENKMSERARLSWQR
jgi:hypothetical protein